MGSRVRIRVVTLLLLLFMAPAAITQEILEVDSIWWEETTKDLNYEEEVPEIKSQEPVEGAWYSELLGPVAAYTILAILAVLIIFILYKVFAKDIKFSRNVKKEKQYEFFDPEKLDDGFMEMDLEKGLEDALQRSDWKMALRIRFLILLKGMIDADLLQWKKHYSNIELRRQLSGGMQLAFGALVIDVEQAYFGSDEVGPSAFSSFESDCNKFNKEYLKNEK